jgi:glutamate racemase
LREVLEVPVIGVIEPGAAAAVAATRNQRVGVMGTRATVQSGAYERAIHALRPSVRVEVQACPLLVPLIEEGWLEDGVTEQIVGRYLDPMLAKGIDTLVLGCTHYPLLYKVLERHAGPAVRLVDSAKNCALEVESVLAANGLSAPKTQAGLLRVTLTDPSTSFLKVAEQSLGLDVGEILLRPVG